MSVEHLPKKKRKVSFNMSDHIILVYGPPGVGKTTWASRFPDALFLATEDGQRAVECYHVEVNDWKDFVAATKLIRGKEGKRFRTIIIDIVDNLYKFAQDAACAKLGIEHPADKDWGKGWEATRDLFKKGISALTSTGKGLILISHSMEREVKTRALSITKTMPSFSRGAAKVIEPMAGIIVYAGCKWVKNKKTDEKEEKRYAIVKPQESLEAKDRTGRLPTALPLDGDLFQEVFEKGGTGKKKKGSKSRAKKKKKSGGLRIGR